MWNLFWLFNPGCVFFLIFNYSNNVFPLPPLFNIFFSFFCCPTIYTPFLVMIMNTKGWCIFCISFLLVIWSHDVSTFFLNQTNDAVKYIIYCYSYAFVPAHSSLFLFLVLIITMYCMCYDFLGVFVNHIVCALFCIFGMLLLFLLVNIYLPCT